MDREQISKLYEDLGFPSAQIFYKQLKKRKVAVTLKMVQDFVKSRSERSISAPPPKFHGKIVAFDINHKWFADVISFVSRPVKSNDGEYKYVLIVQDVFSRYIWTRPMIELSQVTNLFEDILKESDLFDKSGNPIPQNLTSDSGTEWTNDNFQNLCQKYNIVQSFKTPLTHDIGTIDRAIGVLKKIIQRIEISQGGNWFTILEKATNIYNNTENGITKAEPDEVADDPVKRFDMKAQASINFAHNTKLIKKRKKKLEELGFFRIHQPNTKLTGLKQRIDSNQWSKDIFEVTDFPKPGYVEDQFGRQYPSKLVLPIPGDSSKIFSTSSDELKPFAVQLKNMLQDERFFTTIKITQAGKDMKRVPNFTEQLAKSKLTFKQFIERYPDILKLVDGMIFPA